MTPPQGPAGATRPQGPAGATRPQDLAEQALALSRTDGCIAVVDQVTSANLRWANNTLTTNGVTSTRRLTVVAVAGASVGVISRAGVGPDGVEDVVRAAEDAARAGVGAEDAAPLVTGGESPAWSAPPQQTSVAVFADFAASLGESFGKAAAEGRVLFGFAEHEIRSTYLASSTGLRLHHDQPTGTVEVNAKNPDFSRSAWAGRATTDFAGVDAREIDAELARRLAWAERRVDLPPGRYDTILPPSATADFLVYLYWSLGARDAHDGRTVFSRPGGGTRLGEALTDAGVTLRSDPSAAGLVCAPFALAYASGPAASVFDNGLALAPTHWIRDGRLESLVQTRHSAALTSAAVTPGIDNLIMEGPAGGGSIEDLVGATERGLLLTCLWYIREVDPQTLLLTGLTRDGVYVVEGGEVVGATNNFRFNESPVDLLGRLQSVGATVPTLPREWADDFKRVAMPAVRVGGFNMSSVSEAT